jgi:hypothetical protein
MREEERRRAVPAAAHRTNIMETICPYRLITWHYIEKILLQSG